MRKINYIVIHHSKSKWGCAEEVIHWHTDPAPKGNGWSRPGYHYIINNGFPTYRSYSSQKMVNGWDGKLEGPEDGLVEEEMTSNGVLAFNGNIINICIIGDYSFKYLSIAQIETLERLCTSLLDKYGLDSTRIIGHCDAVKIREQKEGKQRSDHNKDCPGKCVLDNIVEMSMKLFNQTKNEEG